jgi:hypothetical protein
MAWHAQHVNKVAKMIREQRNCISTPDNQTMDYYWNDGDQVAIEHEALLNYMTLNWAEFFEKEVEDFDSQRFIVACGFTGK